MDIEQLKLILEAARAAGDGAMEVVFVFFAYKFVGLFLKIGLASGVFYGAFRLISSGITSVSFKGNIERIIGNSLYYTSDQNRFEKWLAKNYEDKQ